MVTRHRPVLGQPLVCRAATVVSLYRSLTDAAVLNELDIEIATACSTAAGPPMFEHREGHPAPPGAGIASRLPRGHGSLALSLTDATAF